MIRTALKFGAFVVLTVSLTAFIGAQIAKIQFGDTYRVAATFDDVTGLTNGDDVKVAGVKVGQVAGALARVLRLSVVAEGVETQQQLRLLREQGCDVAQGYLFSRPVPAGEFARLLAARVLVPAA